MRLIDIGRMPHFGGGEDLLRMNPPSVRQALNARIDMPMRIRRGQEKLLVRVMNKVDDIIVERVAIRTLHALYDSTGFQTLSGYDADATRVYVAVLPEKDVMVLCNEQMGDIGITMRPEKKGVMYDVGRIDASRSKVVDTGRSLLLGELVQAIQTLPPLSRKARVEKVAVPMPSMMYEITRVSPWMSIGSGGVMAAGAVMTYGIHTVPIAAAALGAAAVLNAGHLYDMITGRTAQAPERVDREKAVDAAWRRIAADVRSVDSMRSRYDAAQAALAGSLDMEDISALSLIESTLIRVSTSHEAAIAMSDDQKHRLAVIEHTQEAMSAVIMAAERRMARRTAEAMENHRVVTEFARSRSDDGAGSASVH